MDLAPRGGTHRGCGERLSAGHDRDQGRHSARDSGNEGAARAGARPASERRRYQSLGGKTDMTARQTVERYYERLGQRAGWDAVFSDDVVFTNFATPVRRVSGKEAFLQATRRFYGSIG